MTPIPQKSTEQICAKCLAWLCASDDAFCSACGEPSAKLQLEALPAVLSLGQMPPKIGIKLTNPTCAKLRIKNLDVPAWLDVKIGSGEELAAGASRSLLAKANISNLREPESSELRFRTSIGDASVLLMVIPELPLLQSDVPELMYWPDRSSDYELSVAPPVGHLRVLRVLDPTESWLSILSTSATPCVISKQNPLKLSLRFDGSRRQPNAMINALRTIIPLQYESAHGPVTVPFPVNLAFRKPPELTLVGEHAQPRLKMRTAGQSIELTISNLLESDTLAGRQNGDLEIHEAVLLPPEDFPNLAVQPMSPTQLHLAGGESGQLLFESNLENVAPGFRYFRLDVKTNRLAIDRVITVPINVREMTVFEGAIAIDFGTSNTCCALLSDAGEISSVTLDEFRTTAPTLVRYLDLSGAEAVIETGVLVKDLASVDEQVASSTVSRLKQQLGEATFPLNIRPKNSKKWLTREARQAAADYLRQIRVIAEKSQGVKFEEFILTHPAVCSLRQFRNLRSALGDAFGDKVRVQFLQEPVASLVPFFSELSAGTFRPSYTVAAFDLGGGTTDVTVVRVDQQQLPTGTLEIRPEIMVSWGERFGGEDLTDFLVSELRARCRKVLVAKRPGYALTEKGVRGASTPSILRNDSALRQWAENFKASLSEEKGNRSKLPEDLLLNVVPEKLDQLPDNHRFPISELNDTGENLENVFRSGLRSHIERLASRLAKSVASSPALDFIQLSGKTAFLGDVSEVLRQYFPRAELRRPLDPKECVVKGACMSRSLRRGRGRRLVLSSNTQRTTSQIGMMDDDAFRSLIGLDCVIPDEGLTVEAANAWDGQGPVVLFENLGAENSRILEDGSGNRLIAKLGSWEPSTNVPRQERWWTLRLTLDRTFKLSMWAMADGEVLELRSRDSFWSER